MSFAHFVERRWYQKSGLLLLLWWLLLIPFEIIYRVIIAVRRWLFRCRIFSSWRAPVPVIVVGNLSVGGTGKTPLTIALSEILLRAGYKPGIVSRGYRASPPQFPFDVKIDSSAEQAGDEPALIARRTKCPVVIAPQRVSAVRHLLENSPCDVIICDDGLQHYALRRDIEIVVVDGARGFGNQHCLPIGPLREPMRRLRSVDAIVVNGADTAENARLIDTERYGFHLQASAVMDMTTSQAFPPRTWSKQNPRVHAVAGIGNPARFFTTLRNLGCEVIEHAFPDHHAFSAADLNFGDNLPIVMTEKDAVKCAAFANDRLWYLQVSAKLPDSLVTLILDRLRIR